MKTWCWDNKLKFERLRPNRLALVSENDNQ